jgi:hypothetical protein
MRVRKTIGEVIVGLCGNLSTIMAISRPWRGEVKVEPMGHAPLITSSSANLSIDTADSETESRSASSSSTLYARDIVRGSAAEGNRQRAFVSRGCEY